MESYTVNKSIKYRLSGISYNKSFDIDGFEIQNFQDSRLVDIDTIESLVNSGELIGCEVIHDENNIKHVASLDVALKELPIVYKDNKVKTNELKAVAVLIQNNEPYGFRFKWDNDFVNYGLDVTWELARRGNIINIEAGYDGEAKVLNGKNSTELWKLPSIVKEP